MNLAIGAKIRQLRGARKMPQEQLAMFLGVTPQAVSRWENGAAYPDIELLPALADCFSVSTDDLLGVNISKRDEELAKMKDEIRRLYEVGTIDERVSYARQCVARYPSEFNLQENLACCLSFYIDEIKDEEKLREAEAIYLMLLDNAITDEMRWDVLCNLSSLYANGLGDPEKAVAAANRLPRIRYCREFQKACGVGDGNTERYIQDEIEALTDCLGTSFQQLVLDDTLSNEPDTWDKKIMIMQTSNALYKMIYGDNLMFYNTRLCFNHWIISTYQISQGKTEEALDSLEQMCVYAVAYDESFLHDHGKFYSSPFTDKLVYPEPSDEFHELIEHSQCYYMLDRLRNARYDVIRATPRFIKVIETLKTHEK